MELPSLHDTAGAPATARLEFFPLVDPRDCRHGETNAMPLITHVTSIHFLMFIRSRVAFRMTSHQTPAKPLQSHIVSVYACVCPQSMEAMLEWEEDDKEVSDAVTHFGRKR